MWTRTVRSTFEGATIKDRRSLVEEMPLIDWAKTFSPMLSYNKASLNRWKNSAIDFLGSSLNGIMFS
jgi:hypothetical protein